jgi:F-type H+-transporting ATPase subunit a
MDDVFYQVAFRPFGIPVRDTVISTWIMMAIVVGSVIMARRRWPTALEMLVEFLSDTVSNVMKRPADPYLPFLGSLAIFIAVANVVGVVPIVVTPTRDINTPLALAIVVFFSVHYFAIRAKRALGHLKALASPVIVLPMEIIGQLSRTLSLTVRLFGNVISTELIVAVVYRLLAPIAPLVFVGFSILTGLLQSYVFTVLASSYIGAAVEGSD